MGQYSELIGSFVRTSDYPLEANYIFQNEEALQEFYSKTANKATLHPGLLKIVMQDENNEQALYWTTGEDLVFKKLITLGDRNQTISNIETLQNALQQEIQDRTNGDNAIWGTTKPENISEDLNSIIDLANAITELRSNLESLDNTMVTDLQRVVGTSDEDIVSYLDTLPYSSITQISDTLNKFFNSVDSSSSKINTLVELNNFLEGYEDTQKLRTILNDFKDSIIGIPAPSEEFRTFRAIEDFVRKENLSILHDLRNCHVEIDQVQTGVGLSSDGSFSPDQETYFLQSATSVMNALKTLDGKIKEILSRKDLQFSETPTTLPTVRDSVVTMAVKLSPDLKNQIIAKGTEGLYLNIKSEYLDGVLTLKVNDEIISVHDLGLNSLVEDAYYDPTTEMIVINFKNAGTVKISASALIREWDIVNNSPITLTREQVVDGTDKLSADVKLSNKSTNILRVDQGSLLVEGVTSNITHDGVTLSIVLNQLNTQLTEEISKTTTELNSIKTQLTNLDTELSEAKSTLEESISTTSSALDTKITTTQTNLTSEINRALTAESTLQNNIDSEAVLRKSGDDNLGVRIDAIDTKLNTLQSLVNANATNISTIDNRLLLVQQQIESIIQLQRAHGWYEE